MGLSRFRPIVTAVIGSAFVFVYLYDFRAGGWPSTFLMTTALTTSALAATSVVVLPKYQNGVDVVLATTAFIFLTFSISHIWWHPFLVAVDVPPDARYWLYQGPGAGMLGWLPASLACILLGKYVFRMPLQEQWGGRLRMNWIDWKLGLPIGAIIALFIVSCVKIAGVPVYWNFDAREPFVNCVSNLYEEILCRGLLLQLTFKYLGKIPAIIWTSIVFGLMHGLNEKGLVIGFIAMAFGWAVLRAGSLWCGWVVHEAADVLTDTWV